MYSFLRPLLFRLDPERAHALSLHFFRFLGILPFRNLLNKWASLPGKTVEVFGLTFRNPIGLAAGYDKDGLAWKGFEKIGFGHIEVGTVTPHPQPGNSKPRLFRLPEEEALINRMGFPSRGAAFVTKQLNKPRKPGFIVGVNIGKNQNTALDGAISDYLVLLDNFAPLADYMAINVSSPNTVGLRSLQAKDALRNLLDPLVERRQVITEQIGRRIPLLVKLAPDLSDAELEEALEVILATRIDGVIATNTTIKRPGLRTSLRSESGGLSGKPLRECSTEMIRKISNFTEGELAIIGVGGVMNAEDVKEKLEAGADLVQIYTGLVYQGPSLVSQILKSL